MNKNYHMVEKGDSPYGVYVENLIGLSKGALPNLHKEYKRKGGIWIRDEIDRMVEKMGFTPEYNYFLIQKYTPPEDVVHSPWENDQGRPPIHFNRNGKKPKGGIFPFSGFQ